MDRALSRPLNLPWRWIVGAMLVACMNGLIVITGLYRLMAEPLDWWIFEQLPERMASGTLYLPADDYYWVYAPAAAWVLATVVVPLGFGAWFALHGAALVLLRDWRLIALTLAALPFWIDALIGNALTFVFVAAVLAVRGSNAGSVASIALFFLMPRPLQLPLVVWLLWTRPDSRLPFMLIGVLTLVSVLVGGYAGPWLDALMPLTGSHMAADLNLGPSRWIGPLWLIPGLALAAWLTWKGRVALAGLALTPYLTPAYMLLLLVALVEEEKARTAARLG